MAVSLHMKRMARERVNQLDKSNDDYFVYFEDDSLLSFHAYVMGPSETLYAHKFVKLKIEIPQRYPLVNKTLMNLLRSARRTVYED